MPPIRLWVVKPRAFVQLTDLGYPAAWFPASCIFNKCETMEEINDLWSVKMIKRPSSA